MKRFAYAAIPVIFLLASAVSAKGVDELPADQQALYQRVDPQLPLGPSAFRDFVAKKQPPWKIGYASTYAGNTWRASIQDEMTNVILPAYQKSRAYIGVGRHSVRLERRSPNPTNAPNG
jgi:ribose transport system substrate-binding protein